MIALNILKILKGFVFISAIALLNGADGQLKPYDQESEEDVRKLISRRDQPFMKDYVEPHFVADRYFGCK